MFKGQETIINFISLYENNYVFYLNMANDPISYFNCKCLRTGEIVTDSCESERSLFLKSKLR